MTSSVHRAIERLEVALNVQPNDHFQRVQLGRSYRRVGRFEDAERALSRVLKAEPQSAAALFAMGELRDEQEQPVEAVAYYEQTIAADESHVAAHKKLAAVALAAEDDSKAWQHYEHLCRLNPEDVEILRAGAAVLVRLERSNEAAVLLRQGLEHAPAERLCLAELCSCLTTLQEWKELVERVTPLVAEADLLEPTLEQMGHAGERLDDPQTAELAYRARLARGEQRDAAVGLSWALVRTQRYEEALEVLGSVASHDARTHALMGEAELERDRPREAAQHLEQSLALEPGQGDRHQLLGLALLGVGRFDDAVTQLRHALRHLPDSVRAWVGLADALLQLSQPESATEPLLKAVELEPEQARHHGRLGLHHESLGRHQMARDAFAKARGLDARNAGYWLGEGRTALQLEDLTEAERCLLEASKLDPAAAEAVRLLGQVRFVAEKFEQAVAPLEQALHLDAADRPSLLRLADALLHLGRAADAQARLVPALEADPQDRDLLKRSGRALYEVRRFEEAVTALTPCVEPPVPDAEAARFLGLSQAALSLHAAARSALSIAVVGDESDTEALTELGRVCIALQEFDAAQEPLQRLVRLTSSSAVAWRLLGTAQVGAQQPKDARSSLERALALDPSDGEAQAQLGAALAQLGDSDAAITQLTRVTAADERQESAQRMLAQLLEEKGDRSGAITRLRKVLELAPSDRDVLVRLARLYAEVSDHQEALSMWRRIQRDDTDDVQALVGVAQALEALERDNEAVDIWRQVLRLQPERHEDAYRLGCNLARLGLDAEAVRWLSGVAQAAPTAAIWDDLAACHERLGQTESVVQALEAALALDAGRSEAWQRLGLAALETGRRPRGLEALEKALELGACDEAATTRLADTLRDEARLSLSQKEFAAAATSLRGAARFQGEDPALHQELAACLVEIDELSGAIEHARRAAALLPQDARCRLSLGQLLLKDTQYQAALEELTTAAQMAPADFDAWIGQGQCQAELGLRPAAIESFRRALAIRSDAVSHRLTLGGWLVSEGRAREAVDELQRVLRERPLEADAARLLGRCLVGMGDDAGAVDAWRAVLRTDASDGEALLALGSVLVRLERFEQALDPLETLAEQEELPEALDEPLARARFETGDVEAALEPLRRIVGRCPGGAFDLLLAQALVRIAKPPEALETLQQFLGIRPDNLPALRLRASVLCQLERDEEARASLVQVIELAGESEDGAGAREELVALHRRRADNALSKLRPADAADELAELVRLQPQQASVRRELAEAYRLAEQAERALDAARDGLVLFAEDRELKLIEAQLLEQLKLYDEAVASYRVVTSQRPLAVAHWGLGRCLGSLQQDSEAERELRQALELSGERSAEATAIREDLVKVAGELQASSVLVEQFECLSQTRSLSSEELRAYGSALMQESRFADAVEVLEELLDADESDHASRFVLARALHAAGRTSAAVVALGRLVRQAPERVEYWRELGKRQVECDEFGPACEAFRQVVRLGGQDEPVLRSWVEAARKAQSGELRLAALGEACARLSDDSELRVELGRLQVEVGDRREAIATLREALGLLPEVSPELAQLLAREEYEEAQHQRGLDDDQARGLLCCAAERCVTDAELLLRIVGLLVELGAKAQALQFADNGLKNSPTAVPLAVFVGCHSAERGEFSRAVQSYELALQQQPDHSEALLGIARAHLNDGHPELAEPWLARAVQYEPASETFAELREQVLAQLGRAGEGIEAQRQLLSLRPDDASLHRRLVDQLVAEKRHEDVLLAVDAATQVIGDDVALLTHGARALAELGRFADALTRADVALALQPAAADALGSKGWALLELQRPGEALKALEACRAAGGGSGEVEGWLQRAHRDCGRQLSAAGNHAAAADAFDALLSAGGAPQATLPDLIASARRADQPSRALTAARQLVAVEPTADLWATVGELELDVLRPEDAVVAFANSLQLEETAAACLGSGRALAALGRDDEATVALHRAEELRPDPLAWQELARIHWRAERWQEAADCLGRLAQLRPLDFGELRELGVASERLDNCVGAGRAYEAARVLQPTHVENLVDLGRVQLDLGAAAEAVSTLGEAGAQQDSHPEVDAWLGRALAAAGQPAEAVAALERQIARSPQPELVVLLAQQQALLGDTSTSLESLVRVTHMRPEDAPAHGELARAAIAAGQFEQAASSARRAQELASGDGWDTVLAEALLGQARAALMAANKPSALSALTGCLELPKLEFSQWGALLVCLVELAEPQLTARATARALELAPGDARLLTVQGRAAAAAGSWAQAGGALEQAVDTLLRAGEETSAARAFEQAGLPAPSPAELLMELATIREQESRPFEAAVAADRGVRLGAGAPSQLERAAGLHHRAAEEAFGLGEAERALPLLQRAEELRPQQPATLFMTVLVQRMLGQPEAALQAAQCCLAVEPTHPGALRVGAELLSNHGDDERLLAWFAAYPIGMMASEELRLQQGLGLLRTGRPEQGRVVLGQLVQHEECGFEAARALAASWQQASNVEEEVRCLQLAAARGSLPSKAQQRLGELLQSLGRAEEAAAALGAALSSQTGDVGAQRQLAQALEDSGRYAEVVEAVNHVLQQEPDNTEALRRLVRALTKLGRGGEAIAALSRLSQLEPQADEIEQLGDLHLAEGDLVMAAETLRSWVRLCPDDARAYLRCGLVYAQLGESESAIQALTSAYQLNSELDIARQRVLELRRAEAERALEAREFGQAQAHFDAIMQLDLGDVDAMVGMATCLVELTRSNEAEGLCKRALGMNLGHEGAALLLAQLLARRSRLAEAEQVLAGALGPNSQSGAMALALGRLYAVQGKLEQAQIMGRRARALLVNDPRPVQLLAQVASQGGNLEEAKELELSLER